MVVQRPTSRRRSLLVLLVLTAVTLITLDQRGSGPIDSLRSTVRDALAPVQDGADRVLSPIGDWIDGIARAGSLKDENARLREELAEARGEVTRSRSALRENERLHELLDLPFVEDIETVSARVVSFSPDNFDVSVVIDRGGDDAVAEGMPVVTGSGLVGEVTTVSGSRATVRLLTDSDSGVGVRFERSGDVAVVQGRTGKDTLRLDFVAPELAVHPGDRLVTSGTGKFPSGIPVGKVVDVASIPGQPYQDVLVEPWADFGRLELVKVLLWAPPAGPEG
ncbi:MAG: rod shape-determining protein MreC [Acidimicrobiia bacterium]|nr:rod shape-determining protein MreC [Acidimicrobiia bacterium]